MDLVELVYKETSKFPDSEKFGLTNQLRRASSSIPSNIAEGSGRRGEKEYKHFLSISLGSTYEVNTQIELAKRLSFIPSETAEALLEELNQLEKMIIGFMKMLNVKNN